MSAIVGLALCAGGCAASHKTVRNSAPTAPLPAVAAGNPPDAAPAPIDRGALMVERAVSMLGQPYRYGGTAPGGFDCSGLVAYAAAGAGIPLPRTTEELLQSGDAVARADIQAADLVFMRLAHKVLHVGIAIDGVRFVHAPSSGGIVRIDSLAEAPYSRGFLAARRVVDGSADSAP